MKLLILVLIAMGLSACTTTVEKPKSKWKVMGSDKTADAKSNFVPSGTELIFTASKRFVETDSQLNIELSPEKRCVLTTNIESGKEVTLKPETVLTVVGYRGETDELVLSQSSYEQYFLSCLSKTTAQKRKTSSVKSKKAVKDYWKKSVVEIEDLKKMTPLFKIKFIPQ